MCPLDTTPLTPQRLSTIIPILHMRTLRRERGSDLGTRDRSLWDRDRWPSLQVTTTGKGGLLSRLVLGSPGGVGGEGADLCARVLLCLEGVEGEEEGSGAEKTPGLEGWRGGGADTEAPEVEVPPPPGLSAQGQSGTRCGGGGKGGRGGGGKRVEKGEEEQGRESGAWRRQRRNRRGRGSRRKRKTGEEEGENRREEGKVREE